MPSLVGLILGGSRNLGARPTTERYRQFKICGVQIRKPRCGGMRQECEALREVRKKRLVRLGLRVVGMALGRERRKEEKAGLSKTWSESWELLAKQRETSERVLGEFCPARSLLGSGGIRQPRLSDPRRKRNGSWLAEAGVRGLGFLRFEGK